MSHENGQNGNRRQDLQNQQSRESSGSEQAGQPRYGQYRGSDYEDPRAEGESDVGPSRQFGQQGRNGRKQGGQSQNTGGHGGYADEQDSRGQNQFVSHRNAQDQYGDPRGQGGPSQGNYGQSGQAGFGQNTHGQSAQGNDGHNSDSRPRQRMGAQSGYGQSGGQMGSAELTKGHRGKGPRSYSRSDERITEDLNEQLMHDDDIDASDVSVRVESGQVTLEGTVPERWMKHCAEDLAERCSGVKDVDNRIRVIKSGAAGYTESSTSPSTTSPGKDTSSGFDSSAGT